ncbi:hypothetical protein EB118_23035 [bacterium]|nr:hypothetical protein [bacterium]NDG32930.1 hypothetical protein [bacterium]
MPLNEQVPFLFTISVGQTLTIINARSISVLASGGACSVVNSQSQTMTIPDGTTIEINADTGNTLTQFVVTATSTAFVVMLGGSGAIT